MTRASASLSGGPRCSYSASARISSSSVPACRAVAFRIWMPLMAGSVPPSELGDEEGHLQALLGVQTGIGVGGVVDVRSLRREAAGAAQALGDIVAGQLEMDAAGTGAVAG